MYITHFIPTIENHTIEIPEEFYGKEIIVEFKNVEPNSDEINRIRNVIGSDKTNFSVNKFTREVLNDFN
ncbi:MAG: hypothetical protein SFY32_07095 [Bacteroidota bacterium]|nr:hypothetical protein [Bacteroidota bacterium]